MVAEEWVRTVPAASPRRAPLIGGPDCEWKLNYSSWSTSKVAILQLCAGTRCLLLHLFYVDRMGCPRQRAAVATVFMAFLLASQEIKHHSVHVRKLLINTIADGNSRGVDAAAVSELCSVGVVAVSQGSAGSLPNGIPFYSVTITNTCLDCTVRDIHVSCGQFASTELVDPSDFRRLSYGDCLVRDGEPMGPGETISFEYSNSFIYKMDVATVSCGDI